MPNIWVDVDTAVTLPVNVLPLTDDTDFKSIEEAVAWNAAGMDLNWNFVTSAGVVSQTNVIPTTGGDYDWTHGGNGMYNVEMTASGGASADNDTEGYGWFSGVCDGVLPWCGPRIGFRAAGLNDKLCDSAYSATLGLAGTALPAAAADAAGGLPISDAGGLDLDDLLKRLDRNADLLESQRGGHTWQGDYYYVDPINGDTHANGNRGGRADPYKTIQDCHDNAITDNNHDVIFLVSGAISGATTHTVAATTTISKNYVFIRGPGRNFIITRTGSGDTLAITGDGVEVAGSRIGTAATGSGDGIDITDADFARIHHCWFLDTQGDGVHILRGSNCRIHNNDFDGTGVAGSGDGIHIVGTAGSSNGNSIFNNEMHGTLGDAILIEQGTTNDTLIYHNDIHDAGGWGINIGASSTRAVVYDNVLGNNSSGDVNDAGTSTIIKLNESKPSYDGGAVWIDTNASNTNTASFVDGTAENPVSTLAAATTIAGNLNIQKFMLIPGSSITLTQAYDNYIFDACHSTIALGGQSVNNTIFYGAVISGNDDGSNASHVQYFDCVISTNTLGQFVMTRCYFTATLTLAQAGSYFLHQCFSGVAGTSTPALDFGSGLNASNVNMRDYSGGIEIENMGKGTGNYNMSLEGNGQLIINANSTADGGGTSTVAIRGNFTVTDNAGGVITLSDEARYDGSQVQAAVAPAINVRPVWYVTKSGHDTNNDGKSWSKAFLTVGAAVSAASAGDMIMIGPGTYAEAVDASGTDNLEFIGAGLATFIQTTSQDALKVGNGSIVRNLKTESTHAVGHGINLSTKDDVYLEDVTGLGVVDGILIFGQRVRTHNCYFFSGFDAVNAQSATDFLFTNTIFETDGTYGTGEDVRALYAYSTGSGILRNCQLIARRNDVSTKAVIAFGHDGTGQYVLENTVLIAEEQNAGGSGAAIGVGDKDGGGFQGDVNLVGCHVYTSQAGGGAEYHLSRASGVLAVDGSTQYDTTKTNGTITKLGEEADVTDIQTSVLAKFATEDTGEVSAASGSVAKLAQGAAAGITNDSVADAVWDELLAGHADSGSAGEAQGLLAIIKAATDMLGTALATVSSPVAASSDITLIQYDDYDDDEGRSLEWTNADGDWGTSDDITGATPTLIILDSSGAAKLEVDGTVVTPTGTQKVRVELLNTETADLDFPATYSYQLRLVLDNERQMTIATGNVFATTSGFSS